MTARPPRARRSTAARLDAVYAQIPDPGCKGLPECVAQCGSIGMTVAEQRRIYARHRVHLPVHAAFGPDLCPALADSRCTVYPDRPFVCRVWGAVDRLPCPHGCVPPGGRLDNDTAQDLFMQTVRISARSNGQP